jgi:hypothetical protein
MGTPAPVMIKFYCFKSSQCDLRPCLITCTPWEGPKTHWYLFIVLKTWQNKSVWLGVGRHCDGKPNKNISRTRRGRVTTIYKEAHCDCTGTQRIIEGRRLLLVFFTDESESSNDSQKRGVYSRVWRARALCMSVHFAYYLRAAGMMGREMKVVVKCKPRRHCGTIMKALPSTTGWDLSRTRDFSCLVCTVCWFEQPSTSHGRQLYYCTLQGDCPEIFFSNYQSHFDWAGTVNKTWLFTEWRVPHSSSYDVTPLGGWGLRSPGAFVSITSGGTVATTQPPWCGSSAVFEQDARTLVCRTVRVLITNICPYHSVISKCITWTWYQNHLGSFGDTYVIKSPRAILHAK